MRVFDSGAGGTVETGSVVGLGDFGARSVDDVVVERRARHVVPSPVQAACRRPLGGRLEDRRRRHSGRLALVRSRQTTTRYSRRPSFLAV